MFRHDKCIQMALVCLAALWFGCSASDNSGLDQAAADGQPDAQSPAVRSADMGLAPDMAPIDMAFVPPTELPVVDEEMESFLNDNTQLEGAAVIIVHRDYGVIHRRAYGAFDEDRIYFVASSSKMVAAGIINRLHDDGVLDMNAPVADIVDWGQAHPAITPVQLISNSSGLPGLLSETAWRGHRCQYLFDSELKECAQTIFEAEIAPADQLAEPDTVFDYGGGQWQVAGGVAEIASGKTWAQLFDEIYVQPCGLTSSGFSHQFQFAPEEAPYDFAYPHQFEANLDNLQPTQNPFIEGGLYTTLDDYAALLLMHLRGGLCGLERVHPRETIARMHADRILNTYLGSTGFFGFNGYGMGWWIERIEGGVIVDPGAYGSWPYIDPARNIAVLTVVEADILPEGISLFTRIQPAIEAAIDGIEFPTD